MGERIDLVIISTNPSGRGKKTIDEDVTLENWRIIQMAIQVLVLHRFHLMQLCSFCESIYQQCPDPKESDKHVQELRIHMHI
jgi:hypothetical protein